MREQFQQRVADVEELDPFAYKMVVKWSILNSYESIMSLHIDILSIRQLRENWNKKN